MYTVKDLFDKHGAELFLELVAGEKGLSNPIRTPEVDRPGLSLTGYMKKHPCKRLLIFGTRDSEYLKELSPSLKKQRLQGIFQTHQLPALIFSKNIRPCDEVVALSNEESVPLFRSQLKTLDLTLQVSQIFTWEFAAEISLHGSLVEVHGIGILLQGDSSVGKSETTLGLIEKGHKLISDDLVKVKKRGESKLEGFGTELTKHHIEIRGIGILNIAHLYGAACIQDQKMIDLIVKLEDWDENRYYDRVGTDERFCEILGVNLPYHVLPVKPGRDVVLLLETIALNHRLKSMGYHSAREFKERLLEMTTRG